MNGFLTVTINALAELIHCIHIKLCLVEKKSNMAELRMNSQKRNLFEPHLQENNNSRANNFLHCHWKVAEDTV
jgi:hypothetical protein